eukprot:GEMP01019636.1.p1 GENE.GEMP01019636.1~~GEMP01019636.1.p1  ORF type:complete len:517 (+),score=107.09 GEMP01019636.1:300-1850(+)
MRTSSSVNLPKPKRMAETGITVAKDENFSEWYTQVITRSEMIEYYDISGCYILRPYSFFIWEQIQKWFDDQIKQLGVQNSYFPMFVSQEALETEKSHVEGFSPEVAWVTRSGNSELAKPIAIRPTSETIMYPAFAKWLRSHRDLPLKLNQWNSVIRWEFKQPTPFIRTREFLWQEGHTAHLTTEEASDMVFQILDRYSKIYEELLAVPVIKGIKSEGEKFAGGFMTTTVEAFIPSNGRAIQAATSHHLGQNFANMFHIHVQDDEGKKHTVWQTSWGCTTRSLGIMIMVHGDSKGLVLPPRVAPTQVVLVPIPKTKDDKHIMVERCVEIAEALKAKNIRIHVDDRDNQKPGWKYNYWEVRGVPIRIEVGPADIKNGTCRMVRRDNGEKIDIPWTTAETDAPQLLDRIQKDMLARAADERDSCIEKVTEWKDVVPALAQRKMILAPWCETVESEEDIKALTKNTEAASEVREEGAAPALTGSMKSLCIPLLQPPMPEGTKCFFTGKPAKRWCLFGRSY